MRARSMYETIMDLPLFKGIGAEQVSGFLEKTSVEFPTFEKGEVIVKRGEEVKKLRFIFSGTVKVCFELPEEIRITYLFEGHDVIGITRLFGLNPFYDSTVIADSNVSIMEFSKEKYMRLLQTDSIYMMNYANLISLQAQYVADTTREFRRVGFIRLVAEWLVLYSNRRAHDIRIEGVEALEKIYGRVYVEDGCRELDEAGLIVREEDQIRILSREDFFSYVSKER